MSEDIRIRALDPDNEVEIARVIDLFRARYGEIFPNQKLFDLGFWKTHFTTSAIGLVAEIGREIVAYVALRPERDNPRHVQLMFPVCDATVTARIPELASAAWRTILRLATRQGWEALFLYGFTRSDTLQRVTSEIVGSHEVALLPDFFPANSAAGAERLHSLLAVRYFGSPAPATWYVPERYRDIVQTLAQPLGLVRTIESSTRRMPPQPLRSGAEPYSLMAPTANGVCQIAVTPSLLRDVAPVIALTGADNAEVAFVHVDLTDPAAPAVIDELEAAGLAFAGIAPLLHGRDALILYRSRRPFQLAEKVVSPASKQLANCLSDQTRKLKTPRGKARTNVAAAA